jgi:phosphatidate cytidylyltransferase
MLKKYLTAAVGIPLLIVFFKWAPLWGFSLFVGAFSLLGLWEAYELFDKRGLRASRKVGLVLAGALFVLVTWLGLQPLEARGNWLAGALALAAVVSAITVILPAEDRIEGAVGRLCATLAGLLWVPALMAHFVLLRGIDPGSSELGVDLIFYLLTVVWAADGGAFIVGSAIGRTPLAPALSPKKSREGALGGLAGAVLASVAAARVLELSVLSDVELVVSGLVLGAVGQIGDLVESAIKRSAGVKDSGTLFPGHGGILDRADSLVLTVPLLYYYLVLRAV